MLASVYPWFHPSHTAQSIVEGAMEGFIDGFITSSQETAMNCCSSALVGHGGRAEFAAPPHLLISVLAILCYSLSQCDIIRQIGCRLRAHFMSGPTHMTLSARQYSARSQIDTI
jgi:hypothetical protein